MVIKAIKSWCQKELTSKVNLVLVSVVVASFFSLVKRLDNDHDNMDSYAAQLRWFSISDTNQDSKWNNKSEKFI